MISLASVPLIAFGLPALAGQVETAPRYEWWLRALHIVQAWRSGDNGAGVTIAVLSDGVAADQPYLRGSVITGPDFTRSGRTAHSAYYGLIGTGLASLIVGHSQPAVAATGIRKIDGIALRAKVLSIRVTLSPGDPLWSDSKVTARLPDAIAAGIRYAVRHGASVIDLPTDPGITDPGIANGSPAAAGGSPAERAAVSYAQRHGALLVAPAGDNGQAGDAVNYPAAYRGVVAVGAFGPDFIRAPFSSGQSYVTLTAAGQDVVAANQTGFTTLNSTCAAAAIVTGIAALIRSEFPNLTASRVWTALTASTVYKPKGGGRADGSGFGTVDAWSALISATTASPPHAMPAMLGAEPRTRPVTPPVESAGALIVHDLTGDAEVSALVLALLLIPITMYGALSKRRERQEALLAAERSRYGVGPSGHGSMLADPLLEFFGPQHSRPAEPPSTRPIPTPRFQPRPGLTGRSTMSASLSARAPLPLPAAPAEPPPLSTRYAPHTPPVPAAQAAANGSEPGSDLPASFMGPTVRHVPVSGSPPWEPAPEPTSQLPWAVIAQQPAPTRAPGPEAPDIPPPPDSVWASTPARRSSAPQSLFEPTAPPPQPAPLSAPTPPPARPAPRRPSGDSGAGPGPGDSSQRTQPISWRDLPGTHPDRARPEAERGPIFVWQPMESTDQFAAMDPSRPDSKRRRD